MKTAGVVLVEVWAKCLVAKYGDRRQLGAGLCMQYGLASEAEARLAASGTTVPKPRVARAQRVPNIFSTTATRRKTHTPAAISQKTSRVCSAAAGCCPYLCARLLPGLGMLIIHQRRCSGRHGMLGAADPIAI